MSSCHPSFLNSCPHSVRPRAEISALLEGCRLTLRKAAAGDWRVTAPLCHATRSRARDTAHGVCAFPPRHRGQSGRSDCPCHRMQGAGDARSPSSGGELAQRRRWSCPSRRVTRNSGAHRSQPSPRIAEQCPWLSGPESCVGSPQDGTSPEHAEVFLGLWRSERAKVHDELRRSSVFNNTLVRTHIQQLGGSFPIAPRSR